MSEFISMQYEDISGSGAIDFPVTFSDKNTLFNYSISGE
jgi:hypothetical protein